MITSRSSLRADSFRSSSFLRKGESLRWTAYSNECLRVLETQKETASDMLLVQLVKLRLISEKLIDAPWSGAVTHGDQSVRPPAMFYLKSLESQIQDFKSKIPNELADNSKWLPENQYCLIHRHSSIASADNCNRNFANGPP